MLNEPEERPAADHNASDLGGDELPLGPPSHAAGIDGSLIEEMAGLRAATETLTTLFDARLLYDETKEEAFRRLYADLEQYKGEAARRAVRPLLLDLVLLADRIERHLVDFVTADASADVVRSIDEELIEALERHGVERLTPSEQFDPTVHRALEVEDTVDVAAHNSVAAVIRYGFVHEGYLLRPEEVRVRRYRGPTPEAGQPL